MAARKPLQQTSRKSSRPLKDQGAEPSPMPARENLQQSPASSKLPLRDWTVLFYLCGDHRALEKHIEEQLNDLWRAGSSKHMHIAVQRDCSQGAGRFVMPQGGAADLPVAEETLGGLDTGDAAHAMEFLRWGLERCPSRHVAVVFGGVGISHDKSVIGSPEQDHRRLFAFCDDATSKNALDASVLQDILRQALEPTRREKVDLILFDMCRMQFLEVAYQLEGLADVMVGAQTMFPDKGWPYQQLLSRWEAKLGTAPAENIAKELARIAVEVAGEG